MNHSCEPNVFCSSGHNDHRFENVNNDSFSNLFIRAQFVAFRDIQKGEEITRSYINEDLPLLKRRKELKEHYDFLCRCRKCLREEK